MSAKPLDFNFEKYCELLRAVASLTRLFSDNSKPYVSSRFVERLYVACSGAVDVARKDISYDAVLNGRIGVGVKTFSVSTPAVTKSEKIAEFTADATRKKFEGIANGELATRVAESRNKRIQSDAKEMSVAIDDSIYHCLIRYRCKKTDLPMCRVHEEPYQLIRTDAIVPIDQYGAKLDSFDSSKGKNVYFTDGRSRYTFSVAKNVLYKHFDLSRYENSAPIECPIYDDVFERVLGLKWDSDMSATGDALAAFRGVDEKPHVILPLYSTRGGGLKSVPEKSGINQWNAGGRKRSFKEAYIPVPRHIHRKYPDFFPDRDRKFELVLPSGRIVSAKICQDGNKALMSDPNTELCDWLYDIIDGGSTPDLNRFYAQKPYSYEDLVGVGKDSVRVEKVSENPLRFSLRSAPLGSYESFLETPEG